MLLLGMTISGLVVVASCFVAKREGVLVVKGFDRWLMAASIFTVGVNLVVTILLCWRIWCIGKEIPIKMRKASRRYRAIIHALIESGGVYSAAVAIQAIVNVAGMKSAAIILSYVMPQMVGLAPTWIVIRLHSLSSQQSFTTKSHC
ncbi:hypothetical protein FRC02_011061 [Tulasnella sp. 418]|nr:hypothetical protein FRC02_011061 [Tulasnella sp. 418]